KGGYFKFFSKIKQAKKEFKALKESKVYRLKDKFKFKNEEDFDLFIKNYALIENLLTHYEALNEVIVLNMAFVLEHFDEVSLWLNSREFKEKYEDINHPYPPLLNPDKLNDENYILNYEKIPANLAWEMNLPLPRRYEFVLMFSHGAGALAMNHFLFWSAQFNLIEYFYGGVAEVRYSNFYQRLLKENNNIVGISDTSELLYGSIENRNKLWSLIDKKVKALVLVRDPIELIKHCYGRKWGTSWAKLKEFTLEHNFEDVIKAPEPYNYDFPSTYKHLENQCFLWNTLKEHFPHLDFKYLDVREFTGSKTIETMKKLALEFGFNIKLSTEEQENMFVKNMFAGNLHFLLPLTLKIDKIKIEFSILKKDENLLDLRKEFELKESQNQLGIYILKSDYKELLKNHKLYEKTLHYIQNFYNKLLERIKLEDELMLKPEDILEHLKKDEACCKELKGVLDYESKDLKATRPDIVNSWKYYKEFEKMCEEFKNQS
ncbi:DUF2972 domain-containing protein, partial [Campylobacter upsaliensis]|nr:DUF2972 domain-containing protein [Campylobacter upsaliensis]